MNWIELNGNDSRNITGLLIQSLPSISKPLMRTQVEEIDGRDGDIVTKLGYAAYDKELTIGLYGNYDIDEIISYFNSEGTVIFSNEPDKYYNYQIIEQINFDRLIRFRTATVILHCQPFKYSATGSEESVYQQLIGFQGYSNTRNGLTIYSDYDGTIAISGTSTAATEFYVPILNVDQQTLTLSAGSYKLRSYASGSGILNVTFRMINNSPTAANSFGGTSATLQEGGFMDIDATLTGNKTYNYLYFSIPSGCTLEVIAHFLLRDTSQSGEMTITNRGNVESKPTYTIYGAGYIYVYINNSQVLDLNIGSRGMISIDTESMEARDSYGRSINRLLTGNYENLYLPTGENAIRWGGFVSSISINNYSRWI